MNRMISILSLAWSFPGGGVSHYIRIIDKLNNFESLKISHVIIRKSEWQIHQGLLNKIRPTEILIKSRFDPSWLPKLLKIIEKHKINLLMVHGHNGYFLAWLCRFFKRRLPILATYHVPYIPGSGSRRLVGGLFNKYSIYFLRNCANRIITVAEKYRQELIRCGVNPEKIHTVHNGIDANIIASSESANFLRKEGFNSDSILIGTTSRLHPQKGLQFLIQAIPIVLARCPEAHLILFGTGPLKTQLADLSSSLSISDHVHFLGFRENIYELITGLDIFVLPSLAEGHSISLLEAMRAGLPIICTPVGDNIETIRPDRDGIVVPSENAEALSDAIIKLVNNSPLRDSIGQSAKTRFHDKFTENHMLESTFSVIQLCVS